MFEEMTFEYILGRMLDRVSNDFDKREGSVIYDALAPCAAELMAMYIDLHYAIDETYADTATREYLILRAAERGITPRAATKAIRKGVFNIDVPLQSRFSLGVLNYSVLEKLEDGVFSLECETAGEAGNRESGRLIPINYIDGLESATLTDVIIPAENEEDTEALRTRYFDNLRTQAFGGNQEDYRLKINDIIGVGGVKVIPTWNGGGTVKLVIINSDYNKPDTAQIASLQEEIDPIDQSGKGVGIAPIGHEVTVESVTETPINVVLHITYQSGFTWNDIRSNIESAIDGYFYDLRSEWANSETVIVRVSQIETRVLNVLGVLDVGNTAINGNTANVILDPYAIPILGGVSDG